MSHAILGTPAAEVRKLQNLVDDGRRLRAQLRRVARALDKADPRERTAARAGLDTIARRGRGWSRENRALLVSLVVHYYPPDRLVGLPRELLEDAVLANLDVKNLAAMAAVSRAARRAASSDAAWRPQYARRFGAADDASEHFDFGASLRESFRQRLGDPAPGDRVEIAWRGRFRLEGLEVYRGLAWWAAEVVEKRDAAAAAAAAGAHESLDDRRARKYKVHYVHWDARWDEWVARDQLRWPVPEGRTGVVASGDDVEVWCSGSAVPGASAPESLARDACATAPALTVIPRRWLPGASAPASLARKACATGAHGDSTQVAARRRHGRRGRALLRGRRRVVRAPLGPPRPRAPHPAQAGPGAPRAEAPPALPDALRARARDDGGGTRPPGE